MSLVKVKHVICYNQCQSIQSFATGAALGCNLPGEGNDLQSTMPGGPSDCHLSETNGRPGKVSTHVKDQVAVACSLVRLEPRKRGCITCSDRFDRSKDTLPTTRKTHILTYSQPTRRKTTNKTQNSLKRNRSSLQGEVLLHCRVLTDI